MRHRTKNTLPVPLPRSTVYRLASEASCDPRTIRRTAAGEVVRGLAGERAAAALRAIGYPLPVATSEASK